MSIFDAIRNFLLRQSVARQKKQAPPPVGAWDLEVNGDGVLSVAGLPCTQLARDHGTPLLVVHENALKKQAAMVTEVMASLFDDALVTYSYKTNCIPGIVNIMHRLGIGAEVISPYEFWLAESLGVPGSRIVYNGVDKTRDSIARAIAAGALINIDNVEETEVILAEARAQNRQARLGLRLGLNTGAQFGLLPGSREIFALVERLIAEAEHADLCALHFNVTSNARDNGYHAACLKKALDFMALLAKRYGIRIRHLDMGGGYGVTYSKNMPGRDYGLYRLFGVLPGRPYLEPAQKFREYMTGMARIIKEACAAANMPVPQVIIEPGRLLTSGAEFLLATVKSIKDSPTKGMPFAITDAGRLSQAFPCDFELHEAYLASDMLRPLSRPYTVTGRVCTSADWLYKGKVLPTLAAGDILAVMDAGAYFSSYAMNFAFPRAEIIAVEGGKTRVLRRRESFKYMVGMDEIPMLDIPQ